jgi:predicted alpha/beta hydrolase family esterase
MPAMSAPTTAPAHLAPTPARVLLLPGWLNSGPGHWQTCWETAHGDERVQQADWLWPRRGDWMAQLDEALLADTHQTPVVLAAHSLGCHLVAAWAAHSQHTARVRGALLVAPPDLARADLPPNVTRWHPAVLQPLPFAGQLLFSEDDPYGAPTAARALAAAWGVPAHSLGACGHVNADSALGDWPAGRARVQALAQAAGLVLPRS